MQGFEQSLEKAVRPAIKDIASDYQRLFDSLCRRYKGRPVAEVKPALRREWSRIGGSLSDPELTKYATCISDGTRIRIKVD